VGVNRLAALGHGVRLAPFREPYELGLLGRLTVLTRRKLGDIDQELFARGTEADVAFSANEGSARGLALVRSLTGRPVVSILHHPVKPSKTTMRILSHHDAVACLSDRLRAEALELGVAPEKAVSIPWGPDLSSPLSRPTWRLRSTVCRSERAAWASPSRGALAPVPRFAPPFCSRTSRRELPSRANARATPLLAVAERITVPFWLGIRCTSCVAV